MRLSALAALAALFAVSAAPSTGWAQTPKLENVDVPAFCNANGLAPEKEQPAGYGIPADKGGGTLEYVDKTRAACQQVAGKKPTGQFKRPTICPLGSGRVQPEEAWICRSQKPAS